MSTTSLVEVETIEVCESCKTDKRRNPTLELKINTKCYHRCCTTCLDRTYVGGGRHKCPVPACPQQLMRRDWRVQTFGDLKVEREMEYRRRVSNILKRDEGEFESKRAWDDFLEMRETMIMDLVLKTGAKEVEQKLRDYQTANGIKLDNASVGDVRRPPRPIAGVDDDYPDKSGLIEGLKRIIAPEVLAPYDPFDGMPTNWDYFTYTDEYDTGYDEYKKDTSLLAGGYSFRDVIEQSLVNAFAGFGVIIGEEKSRHAPVSLDAPASKIAKVSNNV